MSEYKGKKPYRAQAMNKFKSTSGNEYTIEELKILVDHKIRNSNGKSKQFYRSLETQLKSTNKLSEKQIACLDSEN